ncbi:MAG: DUF349 domain-containing protein [Flavobacteriaceae bacterium]|nr:DUF349 domain-containing protein [Flavobacteriaceae bacterium]MCY4215995.1 DUF349 domain-containing protein [Flavobacteriaceae bacterium]MCY4253217.1 DUF349 domain-containing protein [Flavobacteriaceae bacterium]
MDKNVEKSLSEEKDGKPMDSHSVSFVETVDTSGTKSSSDQSVKEKSKTKEPSEEQFLNKDLTDNRDHHVTTSKDSEKANTASKLDSEENQNTKQSDLNASDLSEKAIEQSSEESQKAEGIEIGSENNLSETQTSQDVIEENSEAIDSDNQKNITSTIPSKKPKIDLKSLTELELVSLFEKTIKESDWNKQRNLISDIAQLVKEKFQKDFLSRKETYISDGGNQIDFFYHPDYKKQFDRLSRIFQKKKREYYRNLEKEFQSNLDKKRELLEQIKKLRGQDISIRKKYNQIQGIQEQWHEIGPVPRIKSDQLWKDYNHNLDLFYQLLDVHKTQKDEFDQQHFEKLELLIEESHNKIKPLDANKAKTELETLKNLLKIKSGRLGHRLRNEIWNQFKTIRRELDKKISNEFSTNQQIKVDALHQLQNINENLPTSHIQWQKTTQDLNELNTKFKSAHPVTYRVRKKLNNEFYELYWEIIRKKNAYYKEYNLQKKKSLKAKNQIINELETILDSDHWKEKVHRVKELRSQWKEISYTSNKDEKSLWSQFNKLNKLYFNRFQHGYEKLSPHQESVEKAKIDFIKEIEESFHFDIENDLIEQLVPNIELWHGFGIINSDIDYQLNNSFHNMFNQKIKSLELTKREKSEISFECLMEVIKTDIHSLTKHMAQIRSNIDSLQKELTQLENNMQFFDTSSSSNPLVLKTEEKFKRLKKRLEFYHERYSKLQSLKSDL